MPKWLGVTWALLISTCQDITASSFSTSLSGRIWPLPLPPSLHTVFKCYQPTSIIFCVGVQCASSQIQSISQAYHLKHTDVKMCLIITSKYILSYHFPHFCGKEKAVLEFCYVYFWYELKIWNAESCSLKKKKRNNNLTSVSCVLNMIKSQCSNAKRGKYTSPRVKQQIHTLSKIVTTVCNFYIGKVSCKRCKTCQRGIFLV